MSFKSKGFYQHVIHASTRPIDPYNKPVHPSTLRIAPLYTTVCLV
jgi:hypothetical protein